MSASSVRTPIRLALVGGGPGAFIGPVHVMAAQLDGRIRLVSGAFSSDAERSRQAGAGYGIEASRSYESYERLLADERARPDGAQLVAVTTPNHLHLPVSKAALEAGFHVISDKPAALNFAEALELQSIVRSTSQHYALTFTYAGYPLIRQARALIADGALGAIRKVVVEYSQGWLATPVERSGNKQASWRLDPARAGIGGCIADIGVHAFHLAEFVSGVPIERVCAELSSIVPGRALDDDCNILLRFANGAPGTLIASQIATGDRNGLRLHVYGTRAGLSWSHERCDELTVNWADAPTQTYHAGSPYLAANVRTGSRLPSGHPEGFVEALATLYRDMADAIESGRTSRDLPGIEDGVRSMAFIEAAVESSRRGSAWTTLAGTQT